MIDNLLTNYNIKFHKEQLDFEQITKSKLYYKIYNNKISEPLQKFWFSVQNIKYSNNYKNYKMIQFLANGKNQKINNLINFIKDIGVYLVELFEPTFPNISIDYPWKESEQFPWIFNFFTNSDTIVLDSNSNIITFDNLTGDNTFSIIFDISNIKILSMLVDDVEFFSLKINLSLILIKVDEKINIRNYNFLATTTNNILEPVQIDNVVNSNLKILKNNQLQLPFLNEIVSGFKNNVQNPRQIDSESSKISKNSSGIFNIDKKQLIQIKNTLKKVENNKIDIDKKDDILNNSMNENIKIVYMDQKNNLRKVNTHEKSLLNHLETEKKKKKKRKIKIKPILIMIQIWKKNWKKN